VLPEFKPEIRDKKLTPKNIKPFFKAKSKKQKALLVTF